MRPASVSVRLYVLCALLLVLQVGLAWGQAGTSTIRGVITDPQGAVIPNASVTITNLGTAATRTQETSASGGFSFDLIPPGSYKVEVTATGFKTKVITPVQALVGLAVDASAELEVGALSEVVTVEAASTVVHVNTTDATLGNNFVTKQIVQLPLEARNVQALLSLQPGVTSTGYVAGARSDQSNITLDGVDINDAQTNALDSPVLRLNSEAVEEFRVTTTNATASMGRSSGAQVNLVSKSGTNDFHGSLFEFHRNTIFTANDFFNNRAGDDPVTGNDLIPRPKLIRNTFGGSVGGPIKKDKLFFFYSFEGRRDASEGKGSQIVPLPILGTGQMKVRAQACDTCPEQIVTLTTAQLQSIFPAVGLNPASISALAAAAADYPANDDTLGDGINTSGFRFNAATKTNLNSNQAKIDWNINSNQTFFVRLNAIYDLEGALPYLPSRPDNLVPSPNTWTHSYGGVVSHNWVLHNWVNNFRFGLTRLAVSTQGDSSENAISFRDVYQPKAFSRTVDRTNPVYNIVDDVSWIKGNHTVQFGTNIRIIRNGRVSYARAFDQAITNYFFYELAGKSVSNPVGAFMDTNFGLPVLTSLADVQRAATALIGRFTQYTANFTFAKDGSLLSPGSPSDRTFATEEYDGYIQDTWKWSRNLTLTYGLRYGISRPVYEARGFEVKPDIPLNEYLQNRINSAEKGIPYNQPLTLDLSGPANSRSPLYDWDKNNFQPSIAVAWSPSFEKSFLQSVFGKPGSSVFRAGFRITNDYFGNQLAVQFDLNNTLGFSSNFTTPANTFNVTTDPGPLFTGYGQSVVTLPLVPVPGPVTFPREQPADTRRRIESSLDQGMRSPINYQFNLTFERELPKQMVLQMSYVGRIAHNLLATRDVMALNNLKDPTSGMDWYTAATTLEQLRQQGIQPTSSIANIPWFENMFPANLAQLLNDCCGESIPLTFSPTQAVYWLAINPDWGGWGNDWTDTQDEIEYATGTSYFFNPQYGALAAWGSVAYSNYNALNVSLRQRLRTLTWDFNYTWSHSLDNASGLQTSSLGNGLLYGTSFIQNALRPHDWYASSDFDVRHQINVSAIYELPFGRGKQFLSGIGRGADAFIGGWQLSGIFRWNTGLPLTSNLAFYDGAQWATNWEMQNLAPLTRPVKPCVTKGNATDPPKLFGCNTEYALQSFRNSYPGESGPRNLFRLPGYVNLDMGLTKSITMPYNEHHILQLRWEVFNVTNTQRFGTIGGDTSIGLDPALNNLTPTPTWSAFTAIQGSPRVMQIGLRYQF